MYNEEILKKVISLLSAMSEADEITEDSELMDDLGIGSMDVLLLTSNLEVEFSITISEKELRKVVTVGDVVDLIEMLKK